MVTAEILLEACVRGACWGTLSMLSQCVMVQSQRYKPLVLDCFVGHVGVRVSSIRR